MININTRNYKLLYDRGLERVLTEEIMRNNALQ